MLLCGGEGKSKDIRKADNGSVMRVFLAVVTNGAELAIIIDLDFSH